MKVGLVVEQLDPRRGGVEHWTWQFASWLLAQGHQVHVVARGLAREVEPSGIVFHAARASGRAAFAAEAERLLRSLPLDVVHDTGCGWYGDLLQPHGGSRVAAFEQNLLLGTAWSRPFKRHALSWLPRYREFAALNARQYDDPNRIYLALSEMVAADLVRHHHVAPRQIRLVYNGVDTARFSPDHRARHRAPVRRQLGVAENETLLLIVAHNLRLKGVGTLIGATGRLTRAGHRVRTVVVGGRSFAPFEKLARRQGCEACVRFAGSHDDPTPFYAAADLYVQPTFYDPCSLVALEALASGLPVVTSRFNGAGELIAPGVEGAIVHDPADDRELAECVEPFLDASARRASGIAARQLALKHSWERNCREILAIYEEIVARRRAAA